MKKSLDNKAEAGLIYMKEEFQSDGLPETGGNAFIEAVKTWVTMKDSSGSSRDAVITSTQQPDVSMLKTETMHLRSIHTNFAGVLYGAQSHVWSVIRVNINIVMWLGHLVPLCYNISSTETSC